MERIPSPASLLGLLVAVLLPRRDERGLSQSTENAVLLVGAVAVATIVVAAVKAYVGHNMPH